MQFDFNWKPAGGATKVKAAVKTIESGYAYGGGGRTDNGNGWDLYKYTENSDGTGAVVKTSDGKEVYAMD